jgi:hypothetical protein
MSSDPAKDGRKVSDQTQKSKKNSDENSNKGHESFAKLTLFYRQPNLN